jgi:CRISPR/Cas system type I-B associated protein Csh2 (Cas7 group RAMP superfamily)
MEVVRLYWWEHNTNIGQYSPATVRRSVAERVRVKDGVADPTSIGEYVLPEKDEIEQSLPGFTWLVIDGEQT